MLKNCVLSGIFLPIYPGPIRTRSQCQKVYIFLNFDEKSPNLRKKFPKLENVLLKSDRHILYGFCQL